MIVNLPQLSFSELQLLKIHKVAAALLAHSMPKRKKLSNLMNIKKK
jgi:hypothetical protein